MLYIRLIVVFLLTSSAVSYAQLSTPLMSPQIESDGSVTFRYKNPNAQTVVLVSDNTPISPSQIPLTKDNTGLWTVNTKAFGGPGVYEYAFIVDGVQTLDPSNPNPKPMLAPLVSLLLIPDQPGRSLLDVQNVPHGIMQELTYQSSVTGDIHQAEVYTPPGYERSFICAPLPVLYLQHGYSDSTRSWNPDGRVPEIMDNLIAQGRIVPMVVVMTEGTIVSFYLSPTLPNGNSYFPKNAEYFAHELVQDVIPLVGLVIALAVIVNIKLTNRRNVKG